MRPLQLRLAGLHSYKEEVCVDFTTLGQFGLFGIFGDIGSGKSTLLDGITLALYGVIDRVHGRSRRGIVNHHVDRIDVKFRFAVGDVYEVQRAYKRDPSGIAKRVASRICRVDENGALAVIADKEREVNDTVQHLLGLTSDDFMRAVVLPQGRFMEFLHLKGSERRAMLQRIFRLSAYGEGLRSKLRDERERCTLQLETHRGELRGMGDASPAAVTVATRARRAANAKLAERTAAFEDVQERHAAARSGRERQAAMVAAESQLAQHLSGKSDVETLSARIGRAETVALLAVPIDSWIAASIESTSAKTADQVAAQAHEIATIGRTVALAAAEAAQTRLREDGPELRERLKRLDRATLLAGQLATVERDAAETDISVAAAFTRSEGLEVRNAQLIDEMNGYTSRRRGLAVEFSQCQVTSEAREQILAAANAHSELTRLTGVAQSVRAEIDSLDRRPDEDRVCPTCGSELSLEARREHLKAELNRARELELDAWDQFDRDRGDLTFFDIPNHLRALAEKDRRAAQIYPALETLQTQISGTQERREAVASELAGVSQSLARASERARSLAEQRSELLTRLRELGEDGDVSAIDRRRRATTAALQTLQTSADQAGAVVSSATATATATGANAAAASARVLAANDARRASRTTLDAVLKSAKLAANADIDLLRSQAVDPSDLEAMRLRVRQWHDALGVRKATLRACRGVLPDTVLDDDAWQDLVKAHSKSQQDLEAVRVEATAAALVETELTAKATRYAELVELASHLELRQGRLSTLSRVLRGNRFVEFIANDYLAELADEANRHLGKLTADRYTLVLDDEGGFLVRDEEGGGAIRPVTSLSGGETFVASLALALALSTQVQARSAQPLELFFLDEGFGTLDGEALDRVMTAIESLQSDVRTIGVISHVPAVRERVPRYVMVSRPGRDGTGSKLQLLDN